MMIKNKFIAIALSAVLAIPAAVTLIPGADIETKAEAAIDVTTYGALPDDNVDDREAINNAIRAANEAGGGTVTMPAGTFDVILEPLYGMGIELRDNVTLQMDKKTILKCTTKNWKRYAVISIKGCKNASIINGQIHGHRKSKVTSEDCYGLNIRDASNIRIEGLTIKNIMTDGIYLGSMDDYDNLYGCNKITIKKCTVSNSGRNNIAIVDADNVTIDGCTIKKAKGIAPQCGINIEPNQDNGVPRKKQVCNKITIKNTKVTCVKSGVDNNYYALQIMNPWHNVSEKNNIVAKNVKITGCTLGGDCGNFSGSKVTFSNCKIAGTLYTKKPTTIKKTTYKKLASY